MKVLLVNGSNHLHGTTMKALEEMVQVFAANGVETEIIQPGSKPIADCLGCRSCEERHACVFTYDGVNDFVKKAREADGFVFASPVYYAHPSGRLLSFLDRSFISGKEAFRHKVGAAVDVARRSGTTASLDAINKYFGISEMPIAGSTYWNNLYGATEEDVPYDEEGLQTLRNLALNMVWMMRCFAEGKKNGINPPAGERSHHTNFIRRD